MTDPYHCLRCSTIAIGIYNLIFCVVQYGILGWQVGIVKERQWEYENRQLPATGIVDGFQARFPGLYAIYTETPERRRINAMFAIVLICLCLAIIHFMTTCIMLVGVFKRNTQAILPFFFTGIPLIVMCVAYAVLWWSGDIFNEQLTMSVTEFVLSAAINGPCMAISLLYYYRLTGQLSSDKPRSSPPFLTNQQKYPSNSHRIKYEKGQVPPWRTEWPQEPPWSLERKLRRRERLGTPARPITGFHRKEQTRNSWSLPRAPSHRPRPQYQERSEPLMLPPLPSVATIQRQRSNSSPIQAVQQQKEQQSVRNYDESPRRRDKERQSRHRRSKSRDRSSSKKRSRRNKEEDLLKRSPQRVSFKSKPKIYERTPESSVSGKPDILEVQTVV